MGLLFGSPAFAEASKYFTPMRVIAAGLAAWVVATAGCAASASFGVLLFFRCAVRRADGVVRLHAQRQLER